MLFEHTWQQVLAGTKTESRAPVKPGEVLVRSPTRVMIDTRTKWKVGNTYAVQPGRRQKAVGKICLLGIEKATLGEMGPEDAHAEGFASLEEFMAAWTSTHGSFDPNQSVWILRFEREPTPEERAERKRAEQEKLLWRMASHEFDELSAVGHELGNWEADGDLQLKNTCSRCEGSVTVSVGDINMVGYIPLMQGTFCFADYPEQMEAAKEEWGRRLADVYSRLLALGAMRRQREAEA